MTFVAKPTTSHLTDAIGNSVSATNPLPVNPAETGAANLATNQVTLTGGSATQIVAANTTRRAVVIVNNDTSISAYIGISTVSSSTGLLLKAGAAVSIPTVAAVYGKQASGSPVVSYLEVYD